MLAIETKDSFRAVLAHLQRAPRMWVYWSPELGNYSAIVNYLLGYDHAEEVHRRERPLEAFAAFVAKEAGGYKELVWPYVIRELLADGDDAKALEILFALLHEYLNEQ